MAKTLRCVISTDSHVMEPLDLWEKPLRPRFGDETPRQVDEKDGERGTFFFTGDRVTMVPGSHTGEGFEDAGHSPEARLKFIEAAHLDGEMYHPTNMRSMLLLKNRALSMAASEVYNDWMHEFCSADPKRMIAISVVPIEDVDWAIREMKRTAELGFKGVVIPLRALQGYPPYRAPVYDPFWAAAEAMDMPVTLHIATGGYSQHPFWLPKDRVSEGPGALLDLYNEIQTALANDFIFGGILDRFPKLKLVCNEFDVSWIPMYMQHIDRMQEDFGVRSGMAPIKHRASDYMRERVWHGFVDEAYARHMVDLIGADRLVWGSDYPHHHSVSVDAEERLTTEILAGVPREQQELIAGGNAAAVFGL
ncbi:MAG: amidohydrolase [Chloroflexi bacterium]|nr:amidohydrolase [Chloroflexota bacterium]